ncbi:MAG TPA: hypothetical protein VEA69_11605 [Tepidisphaeraceae bacterium]|nr:hypothetical protein [Tepidisphaeraceae bacterium]
MLFLTAETFQPRKPPRRRAPEAEAVAPTPPPGPAVVVSAGVGTGGESAVLVFDRPIDSPGSIDPGPAIQIAGSWAETVTRPAANALEFHIGVPLNPSDPWEIFAQPAWVVTPLQVPQSGTLEG